MEITTREAAAAIRLLGRFQGLLESAIDMVCREGERVAFDVTDEPQLRVDRRDWRAAEELVKVLDAGRRTARKGAA